MPSYHVKIKNDNPAYNIHYLPGTNINNVVYEPAQLQIPGDIRTQGEHLILQPPMLSYTTGMLDTTVTATFPDGYQIVFPIRTIIDAIEYINAASNKVFLNTRDDDGQPLVVPPVGGGTHRRRKNRRRSIRRKRSKSRRA
jgi:hypothetical protein